MRSDIYSLGASLFHMLTSKTLFSGSCSKVMRDHIETEPPNLEDLRKDLPKDLMRIMRKMTAKQPIDRYQSPDEVIKDLEMLRIDVASGQGALPSSRSQILNVITAEKERIASLEDELQGKNAEDRLLGDRRDQRLAGGVHLLRDVRCSTPASEFPVVRGTPGKAGPWYLPAPAPGARIQA